ncbi:phospholipase ABHD3-like isoform X2 [Dunckerocampus dactyliophorus]|uniref:phospholipase ABHD3-like isoform X2 n=1 Tax=Dunckerocampus dactyliophorus TaxID=161453 RepID=UPI002404AC12|nr:phospholipase ABHD3-like isoform X2 [Dunckerocampus dactyliophorus]
MLLSLLDLWTAYWEFVASRADTVLVCSLTAALCYLWGRKSQRPILVCSKAFHGFLQQHCPVVMESFSPTPWCWGGRLQTVVSYFIKSRPSVTYRNARIRTADGGQISLDWVDNHTSAAYPESSTRPTVLLLPGLTGNSQQPYVLHAIKQAMSHGYRCVVFNNRGFGGEELLTPKTFCAANTSDLEQVVLHVKTLYPQAPIFGAGVSMGGMLLLNYLGRKGSESGIVAGLTVSVPWDALKSNASMEEHLNWLLFNKRLTHELCNAVLSLPSGHSPGTAQCGAFGDIPRWTHSLPGGLVPAWRDLHGTCVQSVHPRGLGTPTRYQESMRPGAGAGTGADMLSLCLINMIESCYSTKTQPWKCLGFFFLSKEL